MKDVARAAGVSSTTVSFVLNDVAGVSISSETRARVLATVQDLNYRPNAAAAVLRTNRSHSIGFITDFIASSPFAGDIIDSAQRAAWKRGQLLTIINTGNDDVVTEAAINMLVERRVDGIIYSSLGHRRYQPPDILREVPSVLLNCAAPDQSYPSVVPNEVQGGYQATEALLARGHRCIAFLNMNIDPEEPPAKGRLIGYRTALAAYEVPFDPALVFARGADIEDGYQATRTLLGSGLTPTGIFCGTDRMAMGAYYAAAEYGLSVPHDVSIVGFDDQQLIAANLHPPLSTVALPFAALGRWAVEYLNAPTDDVTATTQCVLPCRFVGRASIDAPHPDRMHTRRAT